MHIVMQIPSVIALGAVLVSVVVLFVQAHFK